MKYCFKFFNGMCVYTFLEVKYLNYFRLIGLCSHGVRQLERKAEIKNDASKVKGLIQSQQNAMKTVIFHIF